MPANIETVSEQMFNWFIANSTAEIPKLLENNNVRHVAWQMCAVQFREIIEEGLLIPPRVADEDGEYREYNTYYKMLNEVVCKFMPVVRGVIWRDRNYIDEIVGGALLVKFEECLNSIRQN